jgi:hypothetical protein
LPALRRNILNNSPKERLQEFDELPLEVRRIMNNCAFDISPTFAKNAVLALGVQGAIAKIRAADQWRISQDDR